MENNTSEERNSAFIIALEYLLTETFEGSPPGKPSAFLDRGIGFFSTLGNLSSTAASSYINGTTISAHTEHAKFYLDRLMEFIDGRRDPVNWEDSWLIETVDNDEWQALKLSLKETYLRAKNKLSEIDYSDNVKVGMAIGMIAHTAYHLGAIRQMVKALESSVSSLEED
ncbi:MAG TPA: hypothetical protein VNK26_08170 [Pyrinomonadaceae bacterium]|nr:hypothetical protein [Pyrinomonadaceae bacterium]